MWGRSQAIPTPPPTTFSAALSIGLLTFQLRRGQTGPCFHSTRERDRQTLEKESLTTLLLENGLAEREINSSSNTSDQEKKDPSLVPLSALAT